MWTPKPSFEKFNFEMYDYRYKLRIPSHTQIHIIYKRCAFEYYLKPTEILDNKSFFKRLISKYPLLENIKSINLATLLNDLTNNSHVDNILENKNISLTSTILNNKYLKINIDNYVGVKKCLVSNIEGMICKMYICPIIVEIEDVWIRPKFKTILDKHFSE